MTLDSLTVMFVIVVVGFTVLFMLLPRYGPHYTSRLTCPNCRRIFNFHWIPGATITSIIYRGRRTLRCPYCHTKSNFDILSTRVIKPKKPQKAKPKA